MRSNEELLELIDQQALSLTVSKSNDDVGWLDQLFWDLISTISKENPENLRSIMSEQTILAISNASHRQISRLASKSICSFTFCNMQIEKLLVNSKAPCPEIVDHRFNRLAKEFVTLVKQEVVESGVMRVTQIFSLSASVVNSIRDSSRSALYTISDRIGRPILRFDESLILQILVSDEPSVPALKFKKSQQCLSSGIAVSPKIGTINNYDYYDEQDTEGRANNALNKELYARGLLIAGHLIKTVAIETGLTLRQVRRIHENVKAAKYWAEAPERLRTTRSSHIFIQTNSDMLQASIVMSIYSNLGGENIFETTNMVAMNIAYSIYCTIRHDIFGPSERLDRTILLPDVWVLAVELRSNYASYNHCDDCKTNTFISVNQRAVGSSCPFHNPTVPKKSLNQQELQY